MFDLFASYSSQGSEMAVEMGVALSNMFSTLISLAIVAATYVGLWFTFKKMGMPGWKGIIPYYNQYVLYTTLWEKQQFIRFIVYNVVTFVAVTIGSIMESFGIIMMIGGFAVFGSSLGSSRGYQEIGAGVSVGGVVLIIIGGLFVIAALVFAILALILHFKLMSRLADAFGLKRAWAWGLTFAAPVCMLILGLNKNIIYRGVPYTQGYTPDGQ